MNIIKKILRVYTRRQKKANFRKMTGYSSKEALIVGSLKNDIAMIKKRLNRLESKQKHSK